MTTCPNCGHVFTEIKHIETDAEAFRGDFRIFPEHLWDYAECLRDDWMLTMPFRPRKGNKQEKSTYGFWVMSLNELRAACAEFGVKALREYRKDFENYMAKHNGLAMHTVAGPQSLVRPIAGKVGLMRTNLGKSIDSAPDPMAAFNRYMERMGQE